MWLRLEAAVGDDPEQVAIREGLAFGKALNELLRLPLVTERGQPTRIRPRVEPPNCAPVRSVGMTARTAPNSYSVAFWPPGLLMLPRAVHAALCVLLIPPTRCPIVR